MIYLIVFPVILCNFSCKKDTTSSSEDCSPFTGITEVDYIGDTGNVDPNDWHDSGIIMSPLVYPNPADKACNLQFGLTEQAFVEITVNDQPQRVLKTLINDTLYAGNYMIQWNLSTDSGDSLVNCIYRIYIKASNNNINYSTYGDLKIEK